MPETMPDVIQVEGGIIRIGSGFVAIATGMADEDEIVYWDQQEWIDDPSLVPTIASYVTLACQHGAAAVAEMFLSLYTEAHQE